MWTVDEARRLLIAGVSQANSLRLGKWIKKRARRSEYVVIRLPRPSGGDNLFGIRFEGVGDKHPLLPGGSAEQMVPIAMKRRDRKFLLPRSGADLDLAGKRVLVAGCGSIGGHLAFMMARAGILNQTLVDHDKLSSENTFRHVLGRRYWDHFKVEALKEEIEGQFPFARIAALPSKLEDVFAVGDLSWGDFDLVLLALGNPTIELAINEYLEGMRTRPAAVFAWLEPLGLGGHALLTGLIPGSGCYECLYTSPTESDNSLVNRASFAAPGQSFSRALSGCGSSHIPYGASAAVQTATIALRLAVDTLVGRETVNALISWKGDERMFVDSGFRTAARYGMSQDSLLSQQYSFKSHRCRICGSAR
ncbi:MAG TPA: ThiF family adenylyltransferase [Thermoanaerobaculia bacterium]